MFPEKSSRQLVPELGECLVQCEGGERGAGSDGELLAIIVDVQKKAADFLWPENKVVLQDKFFHIFRSKGEDKLHGEGRLLSFN